MKGRLRRTQFRSEAQARTNVYINYTEFYAISHGSTDTARSRPYIRTPATAYLRTCCSPKKVVNACCSHEGCTLPLTTRTLAVMMVHVVGRAEGAYSFVAIRLQTV